VQSALTTLDGLYAESKDMRRLAEELIEHYRNLLVLKLAPNTRFDFLPEERKRYEAGGENYSPRELLTLLTACEDCLERIVRAGSDRAAVEICIITLSGVTAASAMPTALQSTPPQKQAPSPVAAKKNEASAPKAQILAAKPMSPPHFDNEYVADIPADNCTAPPPQQPSVSSAVPEHMAHLPEHIRAAVLKRQNEQNPAASVVQEKAADTAKQPAVKPQESSSKQSPADFLRVLKDSGVDVRES
jgi:DNA polymerase III gamma/tau subunit